MSSLEMFGVNWCIYSVRIAARSPVFSHLSASLTGISTIRSCGLEQRLIGEFDALQNVHSGVWQLAQAANCALGLWLDCVSAAFVACVTFTFIGLYDCKFGREWSMLAVVC